MTSPAMLLAGNATAATAFVALALAAAPTLAAGENIALHRPYTWNRPPDYPLTTDPDDARQLTDGLRAKTTPLWRDTAAVGKTSFFMESLGLRRNPREVAGEPAY